MRSSTAWGDAITVIPWQLYLMYGDKKTLEDNFDAMKRWVDFITNDSLDEYLWTGSETFDGVRLKHFGDWLALDAPDGGNRGKTPYNFIASAFYAHSTNLLVKAGNAYVIDLYKYAPIYDEQFKEKFYLNQSPFKCLWVSLDSKNSSFIY